MVWSGKIGWIILAALLFPVLSTRAQQSSHRTFRLHVETNLVQLHVRVMGRNGKPVSGLKKSDFVVKENGHRRPVATLDYVPASGSATPAPPKVQAPPTAGRPTSRRVWIYVDSEVDSGEVSSAYRAIRQFFSSQLQPGFMVSLDGLPFTDNRARLLATLEKMRRDPFGHLPAVPPLINPVLDMEKQADYEWLLYSALLWGGGAVAPPPGFASLNMGGVFSSGPIVRQSAELKQDMSTTEQEMSFYVRSSLFRYLDILHRMEGLQGQKAVVIFRSGLRMDEDSTTLLHQFAAEALRHRIVFYTADSRGLFNINPTTNRSKLMRYGVPIPTWDVSNPEQFTLALNDYTRTAELANGRMEGLVDIAHLTGGKAITKNNDLDQVFKDVVADAGGYYMVGFYPVHQRELGRFRRIRIAVDRPGVTVDAPRGYYEPLPFKKLSKREKEIVLWQALQNGMPRDLSVVASVNVFRGENGQPVAVVSTGVRLGALAAKRKKKISELRITELAEIKAADADTLPTYHGQNADIKVPNPVFTQAGASPTEFVTFNTRIFVSPGKHVCKVVFRDDNTGKLGAEEVPFEAPVYGTAPAASTLLVTHHVTAVKPDAHAARMDSEPAGESRLLQAAQLHFFPQPDKSFYAGDKIYLFYELYNLPSYDFSALAATTRTDLLRNGAPFRRFHIDWRVLPEPAKKAAVLIGTFDTSQYPAGNYQVVQAVPVECHARGKLLANFTLLPSQ